MVNFFLRWLKFNFRNEFCCWNLTHHLIIHSHSFFEQKWDVGPWNGCAPNAWIWVFFQNFQNFAFFCFITQIVKKLHQWSVYAVIEDILPFIMNIKRPLSNIWLLRYKQNIFSKDTQNCFAYNSVTKYHSEAVLYSKRTIEYPLWPHIKIIVVTSVWADI